MGVEMFKTPRALRSSGEFVTEPSALALGPRRGGYLQVQGPCNECVVITETLKVLSGMLAACHKKRQPD